MMSLVEVVDEDDETKPVTIKMKYGERKAKPGRSRREKDLQRSSLYNLSLNLTFKDHYHRPCRFCASYLVIRVKSADTRKIESAAARAISSWNKQKTNCCKGPIPPDNHLQEAGFSG